MIKNVSLAKPIVFLYGMLAVMFVALSSCAGKNAPVTTEGLTLSWSPDGKWIVFPSSTDGMAPELYALNVAKALEGAGRETWIHLSQDFADVIEPVQLNVITYLHLAWSPDGQRIAFTAGDTVYTFDAACLERPATCVNSLKTLVRGASAWLTLEWSPDSTLLLVESTIAGPMVKTPKGIMADDLVIVMRVVVADGSEEVIFHRETKPRQGPDWEGYSPFSPAWSPDGKRIAYTAGKAGNSDLYLLTLDGEQAVRLTQTPDVEEFSPSWSPDGREIMYAVNAEGQYDIYSQKLDGSAPTCVTCEVRPSWQYSLHWPKWSPDGTRIAYAISGRPALFQRGLPIYIYLITPEGEDQVPVIEKGFPGPPFWSPDGTHLAFAFRPQSPLKSMESDIFVIDRDGTGLTNLIR